MLYTFNCGVGFNLVGPEEAKEYVLRHVQKYYGCYEIGKIEKGNAKVAFEKRINWLC